MRIDSFGILTVPAGLAASTRRPRDEVRSADGRSGQEDGLPQRRATLRVGLEDEGARRTAGARQQASAPRSGRAGDGVEFSRGLLPSRPRPFASESPAADPSPAPTGPLTDPSGKPIPAQPADAITPPRSAAATAALGNIPLATLVERIERQRSLLAFSMPVRGVPGATLQFALEVESTYRTVEVYGPGRVVDVEG